MEAVSKSQRAPKSTDRIMEALATLAALLDRTISEARTLDSDLQLRVMEAVQKKEESLQAENAQHVELVRREVHEDLTRRSQSELESALEKLRSDFQAERERLRADFAAERERLAGELQNSNTIASELQVERSSLLAELQRSKEDAAAEISRVRAEAKAAADLSAASNSTPVSVDEIERIEKKLAELSLVINDPDTELSVVIRKNVEKVELDAYLKGLRYLTRQRP
jgi:hypothetical protein